MEVLVTGGHGFVGSHLVEHLLLRGHKVSCLVRPTSNLKWLNGLNVNLITGDLLKPESLIPAVKNKDLIFHCAAALKAINTEDYYSTNIKGTRNLLDAILFSNPTLKRAVIVSSIAAVGPSRDKNNIIKENDPCNPTSDYGKSKLKMEEMIREKYLDKIPITIVRPPVVFGPRDDKCLPLFKMAKMGIHIEHGKYRAMNLVYASDLVKGMLMAALSDKAKGETYFILDPVVYGWMDFLKTISKSLNRKAIKIVLPHFAMYSLAFLSELFGKLTGKQPYFTRKRLDDLNQQYWIYSSEKAKRDFNLQTYTHLVEAITETTAWYKANKWL
ncbi:MAG: hypothetical protein A3F16_05880 [Deltaproteobacteria bacterium RIFCSPHIGHO2_12_FULL_43_9]|nr:MAG: hypothetical protein A3F16_05880 [Deltaproteobacteria bacterium RIFCSPHIGHO2_12_FULL_43_9]